MKKAILMRLSEPLLLVFVLVLSLASCSKEPRKVDISNGYENPIERKLILEVTHRYTNYEDSILAKVAVTLYEHIEDIQTEQYYRRDTTDSNGKITFNNITSGTLQVVMSHATLGEKKLQINIPEQSVMGYEYLYY
ncbi:hypothetical protein BH09BAC1_BH09BAC1_21890 [soil metagenome]